ncbi:ArgR family transcriptional regulator [Fluviispira multicolorata]|uniref:Arginine repressor n=1 Tax=Fluviispira multicolorata TaxID=2654512 RepID=A0A833JFR1_9BACT|nr:ArgR family transcriptional regulator [Fluviispira multicolorata]KAB8031756.1 ArgR family transcriptional regulator [Fluviispira multicolorata]
MRNTDKKDDEVILNLIRSEKIAHQQELVAKLKRLGLSIPQSTLSRRLKKLGVVKVQNCYKILNSEIKTFIPILEIKVSPPNILILHTLPGHANSLAFQLDQNIVHGTNEILKKRYDSLMGTVAGDDTVLVIADGTKKGLDKLVEEIEMDFEVEHFRDEKN